MRVSSDECWFIIFWVDLNGWQLVIAEAYNDYLVRDFHNTTKKKSR